MGNAADVGRGTATGPDESEPGLRVGYPRILRMLADLDLTATFFVEGWNAVHHPERVRELAAAGHEVGLHGWVHEPWSTLDPLSERAILAAGKAALASIDVEINGFRSPGGGRTSHTLAILSDLGFSYDASLGSGFQLDQTGIALLPFIWPGVDWWWYNQRSPVADTATWRHGWEQLLDDADGGHPLVLIAHARVSAVDDERAAALAGILRRIAEDATFDAVPMSELAQRVRDQGRGPVG
ncbi:polysaccharide deacetylase family protein [Microtetraspora sp. NBRC 16547]|uniref:polysaccharide deacetylase family protein n=1 Tax=Microtetraspora sp. NBRC 16547 TaxID=3030993 RepID=UPI002554A63C|nr:polysaccharide deacetylase family protein [Microtetraspora sp. NBRC 16547]